MEELLNLNYWFSSHGQNINIERYIQEIKKTADPARHDPVITEQASRARRETETVLEWELGREDGIRSHVPICLPPSILTSTRLGTFGWYERGCSAWD